jgi:hypothetical protein
MESYSYVLLTGLLIVVLGAIIQTMNILPSILDKSFDQAASKLTVVGVLWFVSFLLLSAFLQTLQRVNREGFEVPKVMEQWKQMTNTYQIKDVCDLKKRIEEKLIPVEKGSPPTLTDQQARERVEKLLSEGTSKGTINCALFGKVNEAKDIDSFFLAIQEVPDTFLIQAQDTAERMAQLLEKQYETIQDSLNKKEGFVDPSVGICSPEVTEERRKFLREKKLDEAAQRCLLPEEVPLESKETVAANKLKKIQDTYDAYIRMSPRKPLLSNVMTESLDIEKKLEEKKKAAESGAILSQIEI